MSMENAMSKKLNGRGGRFVLLAAALLFAWGLRADTATVDGYTYTYSVTDGKVEIGTGEKVKAAVSPNPTGRLTVPSELGGYPVTGLGESAFSGTGVTDVTIPDGVTHIGPRAFASCASLENVTIGSGVTQIDFEVFPSCRHLRNIAVDPANTAYMSQNGMLLTKDGKTLVYGTCGNSVIPSGVTTIGRSAFFGRKLESVQFPSSVTNIGGWAFAWCRDLKLTIPDTVTQIDGDAFQSCFNLNVWLPRRFEGNLSPVVFRDCSNLTVNYYDQVPVVAFRTEEGVVEQRECLSGTKVGSLPPAPTLAGYAFEGWWTAADGEQATAETVVTNDVTYYAKWRGTATVDSYTYTYSVLNGQAEIGASNAWTRAISPSPTGHVTVPSSLGGFPVVGIGDYAFYGFHYKLKSVTIPSGVVRIGEWAFSGCPNLTDVTIPDSVEKIGEWVFQGCHGLTKILVDPANTFYMSQDGMLLTKDGRTLVLGVNGVVTIPSGVTVIGESAFANLDGLTQVTIPAGVTTIGQYAFHGCDGLADVVIPGSVTNIGEGALSMCGRLTAISVVAENEVYSSRNGMLLNKDGTVLIQGVNGEVEIPSSVRMIGKAAFLGCSGLTRLVIPNNVTNIALEAFGNYRGLTDVVFPDDIQFVGAYAFGYLGGRLANVTLPAYLVERSDPWSPYVREVFYGTSVENVTMAEGITTIGSYAFAQAFTDETCPTHVTLPNSVTVICENAFYHNPGLRSVTIPTGVEQIDQYAFSSCDGLTEITIPNSVTNIGADAFNCRGLVNVTVPACVLKAGLRTVFPACSSITNVVLSEGVREITHSAWGYSGDFPNLEHVFIPASVTNVDAEAFRAFGGKVAVTVDPANAVYSSRNGMLLTKDGTRLLQGVNGDITIPPGVTSIDARAFYTYSGLTRVFIPNSVTNIGNYAFSACSNLDDVWMPKHLEGKLNANVFANCGNATLNYYDKAYTVTFRTEEGVVEQRQCPDGVEIGSLPSTPTHTGYAFEGWWTAADGEQATGETAVTNDVTYYAKWRGTAIVDDYTYTYSVLNGQAEIGTSNIWAHAFSPKPTGHVTVPSSLCGFPVVGIGEYAFYNCYELEGVTIPEGVAAIGEYAFRNCSKLEGVTIPESVTAIGQYAFADCFYLEDVTIPEGVTAIGEYAFRNCSKLEGVTIPESVTAIGQYAFQWCGGLKRVHISSLTAWCQIKFDYNANPLRQAHELYLNGERVTKLVLPEGLKSVGIDAFAGCTGLTEVTIHDGVTAIGGSAFSGCSGLTGVTIPSHVTAIGDSAFSDCSGLTEVVIPHSVKVIGVGVFKRCNRLTKITVDPANEHYMSQNDLLLTRDGRTLVQGVNGAVTIPSGVTVIAESAFEGYDGLTQVTLPAGVEVIGPNAFYRCGGLTDVAIPAGVEAIGANAFYGCDGLADVVIPASVTNIGECAFAVCSHLMSISVEAGNEAYSSRNGVLLTKDGTILIQGVNGEVEIPSSVTTIGEMAFFEYPGLTRVVVPASVRDIGTYAFSLCGSLTNAVMQGGVTNIGSCAFFGCTNLTGIVIPDGVTCIGDSAFAACEGRLADVFIPNSVKSIGSWAFAFGGHLENLTLPACMFEDNGGLTMWSNVFYGTSVENVSIAEGITTIGSRAFANAFNDETCPTHVTIPNSVRRICESAFYRCFGLRSVAIPDGVGQIDRRAFSNCSTLTEITIPGSVTNIGYEAFSYCQGLGSVTVPACVLEKGLEYVFWGASSITNVVLSEGVQSIPRSAFGRSGSFPKLEHVLIPASVTNIDTEAFSVFRGRVAVTVDPANAVYSSWNGMLLTKDGTRLLQGVNGDVTIPPGVISIDAYAFFECNLTSLTIPPGVTSIGEWAFYYCRYLTSLTIPDSVMDIGGSAFGDCWSLGNVWMPKHLEGKLNANVFANCGNATLNYYDKAYTVTFRTEEGVVEQRQCPDGVEIGSLPSTPTHTGYAFEGWWTAADGEQATGETAVTNDVTYYAKWRGTAIVDDYTYTYSVLNGQAEIGTGETGELSEAAVSPRPTGGVVIPSSLGGYPVTGIGEYAFESCTDMTDVEIPESVVSIRAEAFGGCEGLANVEIPRNVMYIDVTAFGFCYRFTVDLANAVYSSRNGLLLSKDGRTLVRGVNGDVEIPSSVTEIGDSAFDGCPLLESVTIPDGVLDIGAHAFCCCDGLENILIPQSVTNIGTRAFGSCYNLRSFAVDPANRFYSAQDGFLLNKDGTVLVQGVNVVEARIPDGVTTIGEAAFEDCFRLECVEIPDSVTAIGDWAFSVCESLAGVVIPVGVMVIGDSAFSWCGLTCVTVPGNVKAIGERAFYGCWKLEDLEIARGVESIGREAFGDSRLTTVTIPDSVTDVGERAFVDCGELREVWLPRRLEGQLDPDVFLGCDDALALNYYDDLYTVVFKSDEEGVVKWRLCPAGVALGVLPPSPARAGAVFTGWWTADGEQVSAETVVTGDMTLEARWRVVAAPVITPVDGTSFQDTCTVTIACADTDAVIYCSIDGWAPHLTEAYRYTDPFQIDCTTTIRAIAVRDGVRSACAAATLTRAESLYYRRDAGTAGLSFMTGGNADWDYDWPDRECMRSGSIGNEEESWLQTSVVGRGTFSFRWKVDCEYDDFGEAAWDHLAVFTNGVEAVRMDGTRGWERMSFTFDDDGRHTIRWVFVKDGYDEEDAAYEDCAWLGRFSWNPADVAVDAGKGRTVTVPGVWLGRRTMRAATDVAANGRKVWECYLLGCDPEKAADDFRIASFEVVDGVPAFMFSHTRDGSGVSFEPRIRILGKARLDDAAWTEMPEGGDPALRFFKAEVALP